MPASTTNGFAFGFTPRCQGVGRFKAQQVAAGQSQRQTQQSETRARAHGLDIGALLTRLEPLLCLRRSQVIGQQASRPAGQ